MAFENWLSVDVNPSNYHNGVIRVNLSNYHDEIIRYVVKNAYPEGVYDENELDRWARGNGYVKEEEEE